VSVPVSEQPENDKETIELEIMKVNGVIEPAYALNE
jgi:hypothetical protein